MTHTPPPSGGLTGWLWAALGATIPGLPHNPPQPATPLGLPSVSLLGILGIDTSGVWTGDPVDGDDETATDPPAGG
jgi:hypothetical protein